jgi:myosin regulatory light chain 12
MSSTLRRKQLTLKAKSSKSGFAVFDQIEIQEFKEAFNMIDQDKDGLISSHDLSLMFATLGI